MVREASAQTVASPKDRLRLSWMLEPAQLLWILRSSLSAAPAAEGSDAIELAQGLVQG
jgi:hypothetical protein